MTTSTQNFQIIKIVYIHSELRIVYMHGDTILRIQWEIQDFIFFTGYYWMGYRVAMGVQCSLGGSVIH